MYSKKNFVIFFLILIDSLALEKAQELPVQVQIKSEEEIAVLTKFLCPTAMNGIKIHKFWLKDNQKDIKDYIKRYCTTMFGPQALSNYEKIDECEFCENYYDLMRNDLKKFDKVTVELCKSKGCEFLIDRPDIYENEYNKKAESLENIIIRHCKAASKNKECSLCRETGVNKCKPIFSTSTDSTDLPIREFMRGDIRIVVSFNEQDNEDENVFKKRIYISPTEFYDTCSQPSCFRQAETNSSYCQFHNSWPLVKIDLI